MKRIMIVLVSVLILLLVPSAVAFAEESEAPAPDIGDTPDTGDTVTPGTDYVPPSQASKGITIAQDVTADNPNAQVPSIESIIVPETGPPESEQPPPADEGDTPGTVS